MTAIIKQGQKGPVLENAPGLRKLAVPARQSWERLVSEVSDSNPVGHDVVVGKIVHDTQPDNPRRGVAFVDVRHAPTCRRCAEMQAVLRTMQKVRIPAIVAEDCGGLEAMMEAARRWGATPDGEPATMEAARRGDIAAVQAAIDALAAKLEAKRSVKRRAESIRPAFEALMQAAEAATKPRPRIVAGAGRRPNRDREIAAMLAASAGLPVEAVPALTTSYRPVVEGWIVKDGNPLPVIARDPEQAGDGETEKADGLPTTDDWGDHFGAGYSHTPDIIERRQPSQEEAARIERALTYVQRRGECARRIHERLHRLQHRFFYLHPQVKRCWSVYSSRPTLDSIEAIEAAEALVQRAAKYPSVRAFVRALTEGPQIPGSPPHQPH